MSDDPLGRLIAARGDEERELVVLEFSLAALGFALRATVEAAAIPHWFDGEYLAALLQQPVEQVRPLVARLASLSFVRPFPGRGHALHERTRALLLRRMWQDDRARFVELSGRAERYCAAQDLDDPRWRIERLYQALAVDPDSGVEQMHNAISLWHPSFQYDRCEAMVRAAREHSDADRLHEPAIAWTWYYQGVTDRALDRPQEAKRAFLNIEADGDPWMAASREVCLGSVCMDSSDPDEAMKYYDEAMRLARIHAFSDLEGHALRGLSSVLQIRDDYAAAGKRLTEARAVFEALDDGPNAADCMLRLASIHRMVGEFRSACIDLDQAMQIYPTEDWRNRGYCLLELGNCHLAYGEAELALSQFNKALSLFRRSQTRSGEATCEQTIGDALRDLGRNAEARGHYDAGSAISQAVRDRLGEAYCMRGLGYLDLAADQPGRARGRLAEAMKIFHKVGDRVGQAECALGLSDVKRALGEPDAARTCLSEALSIFRAINARPGIADALLRLGDLHADAADLAGAEAAYREAVDLYAACNLAHKSALASSRLVRAVEGRSNGTPVSSA